MMGGDDSPVASQTVVVVGTHGVISSRSGVQSSEMDWLGLPATRFALRSRPTKSPHCEGVASKPQRICAPPLSSASFRGHESASTLLHHAAQSVATTPVGPSTTASGLTRLAYHCAHEPSLVDEVY